MRRFASVLCGLALVLLCLLPLPALAAYACNIAAPVSKVRKDGRIQWRISFTETEARDTSECRVPVPIWGTIVGYKATKTAGTGTTIHPLIGLTAAFVIETQNHVASAEATDDHINEQGSTSYYSPTGILIIRSSPNSTATDHSISTEILIVEDLP